MSSTNPAFIFNLFENWLKNMPPTFYFIGMGLFIILLVTYFLGFKLQKPWVKEEKGRSFLKHFGGSILISSLLAIFLYLSFIYGAIQKEIEITRQQTFESEGKQERWGCKTGLHCTDFKDDEKLEGIKLYSRDESDSQILILKPGGVWSSPPIFFDQTTPALFNGKLEINPLNESESDIFIAVKDLFRIVIGASDYESFVLQKWNGRWITTTWPSGKSKLFLGRDFHLPSIEPKTTLIIKISVNPGSNESEISIELSIDYKSTKKTSETVNLPKLAIDIPATSPEDFQTKIGCGLQLLTQSKDEEFKDETSRAKFIWLELEPRKIY